jgi:hypothetical protein
VLRGSLDTPDGELWVEVWREGDGWCSSLVFVAPVRGAEMCVRPAAACWASSIARSIATTRARGLTAQASALVDLLDDPTIVGPVYAGTVARARAPLAAVVALGAA